MSRARPAGETQAAASWHGMTVEAVERQLQTTLEGGLSGEEVSLRRARYGPNSIREARQKSPWRIFAAQFADFMILVLLAAAVIAGFLGEPADTVAIVVIVVLNAAIGFVQEYRAENAMAALRKMAAHQARAVRNGEPATVPAAELVPGDIVLLEAGNVVPADLRVSESAQLRIGEAALTGESQPAEKHARPVDPDPQSALGDRTSMAYKGTIVQYGRGRGIVVATGIETELGRIAEMLVERSEVKTPLQQRLAYFGRYLALAALAICAVIFAAGVLRGEPLVRMFLTSVSLAVAAIPEALPAVVTITLALGARRMLRLHALVRRLPAVETLGSVTYICSDKTGTLTENRMRMTAAYAAGRSYNLPAERENGEPWTTFFTALAVSNDAHRNASGEVTGDPTETALLEAALRRGLRQSGPSRHDAADRGIPVRFGAEADDHAARIAGRRGRLRQGRSGGCAGALPERGPRGRRGGCRQDGRRWTQSARRGISSLVQLGPGRGRRRRRRLAHVPGLGRPDRSTARRGCSKRFAFAARPGLFPS